jgi:hypothetical protein
VLVGPPQLVGVENPVRLGVLFSCLVFTCSSKVNLVEFLRPSFGPPKGCCNLTGEPATSTYRTFATLACSELESGATRKVRNNGK